MKFIVWFEYFKITLNKRLFIPIANGIHWLNFSLRRRCPLVEIFMAKTIRKELVKKDMSITLCLYYVSILFKIHIR